MTPPETAAAVPLPAAVPTGERLRVRPDMRLLGLLALLGFVAIAAACTTSRAASGMVMK